ncbi:hypothetical protein D6855_10200 [Butyrivibrio sp. CB08]|uniref:hypothetical protein n=1 Tax=Butyrivibrio sp. CB08 TaxID=2364879 RepID=UPI000EA97F3D|nr:hypothetical protein [Butyrivibrio sp. CB08]RKM59267.1 hypothetical protein D6855_10200 [Butyrivibrio sp. CB08]
MDFNFLATANGIASKYLNQNVASQSVKELTGLDEETKRKFGEAFEQAYDSMVATKALSDSMKNSYEAAHQDDFRFHANRLGYSIDNRVIDMLNIQLSDEMTAKVHSAINSAVL